MNFKNRFKILRLSWFFTLILLGIVIMVNAISVRHFVRFDWTEGKEYAISSASQKILQRLDDIVTAKVFFSGELPPNLLEVRQQVQDILDEFASYAHGNLMVRFLDPSKEAVARQAKALGIPTIRMNILSKDKFEVKNGSLGLALMYGDRHEILPVIQMTENLEYDLLAAIRKLTNTSLQRIGFLEGHNEYPIFSRRGGSGGQGYLTAHQALSKNYEVVSFSLEDASTLESLNTLIIGGPETPFSFREKLLLDQFLMKGGNIVFLIDAVTIDGFSYGELLSPSLEDLLRHYGVTLLPELVLDPLNETISFDQGPLPFMTPYPFWVKAVYSYFASEHPITRSLDSLVFPWISPLEVVPQEGVNPTFLIQSSPGAWVQAEPFQLDPWVSPPLKTAQYPLAVLLEGTFKSFFAGSRNKELLGSSNGEGRLIVIGNSRFLTDQMIQRFKANLDFFLNAVDYLTLDQRSLNIRTKTFADRPLIKLSFLERQVIKWGGTLLMPVLLVLYGLLRSIERKKQKIKLFL